MSEQERLGPKNAVVGEGGEVGADLWMEGRRRLIERALRELKIGPGDRVIDVAAGDGELSALVSSRLGGSLVTHDLSRRECAASHLAGRQAVQGDVRQLPFAHGVADVTVAFEIIEHFPSEVAAAIVRELHRVTAPGGFLLLSTPNRYAIESLKGVARYLVNGTVWNARDQTHVSIYSRRALISLLEPHFSVEHCYGYYLASPFRRHKPAWSYRTTESSLLTNLSFLLFVVARRR